ncbi:hypothetical protein OPV22_018417 [Ensete ventricosum]|uniref:cellulase n=1 Tax=Ensete ventricosum TaxID=4639 RepID=A0AAV8R0A4_ENSVE|nr:hypothetical protein OPV22_018417 [Ensete ventricosum]
MEAVKWGTDYHIKAHSEPFVLYGVVSDGNTDHFCWQRPEDMTTSRLAYRIDVNHPWCSGTQTQLIPISFSATRNSSSDLGTSTGGSTTAASRWPGGTTDPTAGTGMSCYWQRRGCTMRPTTAATWTIWPRTSSFLLQQGREAQHALVLGKYLGKGAHNVQRTTGGLLFRQRWNNMQFVTKAAFLLIIYSDYITSAGRNVVCAAGTASPAELLLFAKSQVDYILGDNPRSASYMVGYGSLTPNRSAIVPPLLSPLRSIPRL